MKNATFYILLTLFTFVCSFAKAEIEIPFKELENNSEYMDMKEQENSLAEKETRLSAQIKEQKLRMDKTPEKRDDYSARIVELELQLFDIKAKRSDLTTQCAIIEQEYALKNNITSTAVEKKDQINAPTNIIDHPEIKALATEEEMAIISKRRGFDTKATNSFKAIETNYNGLKEMIGRYKKCGDIVEAASLEADFDNCLGAIANLDSKAMEEWANIYDTKIYLYSRFLDKISASQSILNSLNEAAIDTRSSCSEAGLRSLTPSLSSYTRQDNLILKYETAIAKILGATKSIDSLEVEIKKLKIEKFDLARIELPLQHFVAYSPISRLASKAHSAKNPPKELDIPSNGELHKIQLGVYSKKIANYAALYNISPVEYYQSPATKKFYYWAGSYKTFKEAELASKKLNQAKLRTYVASWKDGEHSKYPILSVGEYKIRLTEITDEIREKIQTKYPDLQIISSQTITGERLYFIGIFNTKSHAKEVVKELSLTNGEIVPVG